MQDESSETTAETADEANTQDANICVDYEPCKKTVGCSRLCPIGQKHRGACVVNGKMQKPDRMQTEDDEKVDLVTDHVLTVCCVSGSTTCKSFWKMQRAAC